MRNRGAGPLLGIEAQDVNRKPWQALIALKILFDSKSSETRIKKSTLIL